MSLFIGRTQHLSILEEALDSHGASLVVIRGRRRIGKSRLIEEFAKSIEKSFFFSGLAPDEGITADHQRNEFIRQLREQKIPSAASKDWGDLFYDLSQYSSNGRVLIVLDEITWMAQDNPTFLSKLKNAWDMHFKKNPKLILIFSGSDSAWIKKNILSKTGFFGRIKIRMKLEELSLYHCAEFWAAQADKVTPYEKLKILSVMGGIPRYLEEINPKLTAEENIFRLAYRAEGILFNEFDDIFNDLFQKRSEHYKNIVTCLAKGDKTLDDIAASLSRSKGGDLTRAMSELCEDGFVKRDFSWHLKEGKPSKISQYRLSDNYLRFYLKYIHPHKNVIERGEMTSLPSAWDSIIGLQLENLILNNRVLLHQLLKINPTEIRMSNPYLQTAGKGRMKCQIDYLIQTKYNTLYLCEIKFSKNEIDAGVIQDIEDKISKLNIPKRFSIRPVLIHVNGVSDKLLAADYFAHIIDFSEFLKKPI